MTPDYNQIDAEGHVVAYLEDIVRPERVVVGASVVVADSEAEAHPAVVVTFAPMGTVALDVDWSSHSESASAGAAASA